MDEFYLELDEHCIETTARHAHRRLVDVLLEDTGTGGDKRRAVELLREFLEQEDFAKIRSDHPDLAGGRRRTVRVYRGPDGRVRWSVAS
jgi:hypothetical protein